ncbi:MAG: malate synthase A [Chitinophagales bacterium]|nr:malate synthase A [Chitinophagales bacterium]
MQAFETVEGLIINAQVSPEFAEILTPAALSFVADLHRQFNGRRKELLAFRKERQAKLDAGIFPDFLPHTSHIRHGVWTVEPIPADLQDRRVEITGPVDRKMIINALNSGAKVFMADFEDSNSPRWSNNISGQINLRDAILRNISYAAPDTGKFYTLNEQTATLMVRPRGWHLDEKHVLIDGEPVSGGIFDFGLYFFHNAKNLISKGSGPYFYLPKMESHLEARLWNDIFLRAQSQLGIERGTIKATVLIETILASFELHEILYELREHSAGLNCGRWDYIFSFIKKFKNHPQFILPNRDQVTMATPFMEAYSLLVIQTCHQRNVHAMGGMSAFIPIKGDEAANQAAIEKVRLDKEREARNGHDGTWVAHPGLVKVAMDVFDQYMPSANQIDKKREDVDVSAADLIRIPEGTITEEGLRKNINVGILYIESWLRGVGAAALYNLMEDAATAEISRAQVWQWIHHGLKLQDGTPITKELYHRYLPEELANIRAYVGDAAYVDGRFKEACDIFTELVERDDFIEFLTLPAYEHIS